MKASFKPAKKLDSYALPYCTKRAYLTSSVSQANTQAKPIPSKAHANERARQKAADRDLVLDVLSSTATKRDARSYLSRFDPAKKADLKAAAPPDPTQKTGVNLGSLFQAPHAVHTAPQFRQFKSPDELLDPTKVTLHAAVLVIRSTSTIEESILNGIGHTIAQLSRLGLNCMVIVDNDAKLLSQDATQKLQKQVDRVINAIELEQTVRAGRLDGLFHRQAQTGTSTPGVKLEKTSTLYDAFKREVVPVAAPIVYDEGEQLVGIDAGGVALALARSFSEGIVGRRVASKTSKHDDSSTITQGVSLDRIIILDPRGGIPQVTLGGSHVFVNLEQEFANIDQDLASLRQRGDLAHAMAGNSPNLGLRGTNIALAAAELSDDDVQAHLSNLHLARGTLAMLPSTSSALIVTPQAAAYSAAAPPHTLSSPGVGTRSQRNPLIHNLLTDKPLFSSSLPRQRLSAADSKDIPTNHPSPYQAPPTHLKHGMPVAVVPDPLTQPWIPPKDITYSISLDDRRIDVPRLVHLIEDSFGRPLNQEHYFSRIRPILAGVIIAGDYEGGAILTWERPSNASPNQPARLVPYLDKFAVLKRSQGAGGVADVVFSAMVRRCFPDGVCWRSRRGNPVNKWYFERSMGTYKLPLTEPGGQGWTMFWTTEEIQPQRFNEYAEVCSAVSSSWADGKKTLD